MTDTPPVVDGITKAPSAASPKGPNAPQQEIPMELRKRARRVLFLIATVPYLLFCFWYLFLLTVLPSASGAFDPLILPGMLSAFAGIGILFVVAGLAAHHIFTSKEASAASKKMGLLRIALYVVPGTLLAAMVPLMITREPPLSVVIASPVSVDALVAPLAVTFSLEESVETLRRRGLSAIGFSWDFDGDGEPNQETIEPTVTAVYDRQGAYNVIAIIQLSDRSTRRVGKRLVIPKAVFSVAPIVPIVDEPITFSIAHLLTDIELLKEVQWDFNADNVPDQTTLETDVVHTFNRTGSYPVSAIVLLTNQTQVRYDRVVEIAEPSALPFPVIMVSEPPHLISPAPFGTIFRIETDEPIREVVWDFGDKSPTTKTTTEHRVGHTFENKGAFRVTAEVRAESGETAIVSSLVRIVNALRIADLSFDGEPALAQGNRFVAELPASVNLTPRTSLPLIEFSWEAPGATTVGSIDTTLQALYRVPGTYTIWLIAEDPDGRAMRMPFTLEVQPPAAAVRIAMNPDGGPAPLTVRFDASETVVPLLEGERISGFSWIFGDEATGVRKEGIAQESFTFDTPGTYQVTAVVKTTNGRSFQASRTIVVRPALLDACFFPSRPGGAMDGSPVGVSFNRTCSTGTIERVLWEYGDGSESDDLTATVAHSYEEPGNFIVRLTVWDSVGNSDTTTSEITITP